MYRMIPQGIPIMIFCSICFAASVVSISLLTSILPPMESAALRMIAGIFPPSRFAAEKTAAKLRISSQPERIPKSEIKSSTGTESRLCWEMNSISFVISASLPRIAARSWAAAGKAFSTEYPALRDTERESSASRKSYVRDLRRFSAFFRFICFR